MQDHILVDRGLVQHSVVHGCHGTELTIGKNEIANNIDMKDVYNILLN